MKKNKTFPGIVLLHRRVRTLFLIVFIMLTTSMFSTVTIANTITNTNANTDTNTTGNDQLIDTDSENELQTIQITRVSVEGTEIEEGSKIYYDNSTVTITYKTSSKVNLTLIVNNTRNTNQVVDMQYDALIGGEYYYTIDIKVESYTTYYAVAKDLATGSVIEKEQVNVDHDLKPDYHELWIDSDRYPELYEIKHASPRYVGDRVDYYAKMHAKITLRIKLKSFNDLDLTILTGRHKNELSAQFLESTSIEANISYYEYNITLDSREKWVVVKSPNSFEYESPDTIKMRRFYNGFNITRLNPVVKNGTNYSPVDTLTERDTFRVEIQTVNETGIEQIISMLGKINNSGDVYFDHHLKTERISTEYSNGSTYTTYILNSSVKIDWDGRYVVLIEFEDTEIDMLIDFNRSVDIGVRKYGAIVYFEDTVRVLSQKEAVLPYVLNDINDVGIDKVVVRYTNVSESVPVSNRSVRIEIFEIGRYVIELKVVMKNNESETAKMIVYFENNKPVINNMSMVEVNRDDRKYRITGTITDNEDLDSGIAFITLNVNGLKREIFSGNVSLYEFIEVVELDMGENNVEISVHDHAGNVISKILTEDISRSSTTEDTGYGTGFILVLMLCVMITQNRYRRKII